MENINDLNNEDEQYFLEKLKTLGFKLSGVRAFNEIPNNKKACLLLSKNEKLRRSIMASASKNNYLVVFNSEITERKHCEKLFAFIMDESEKAKFPYPELLVNKYIDSNLDAELINDFLLKLIKNYNKHETY